MKNLQAAFRQDRHKARWHHRQWRYVATVIVLAILLATGTALFSQQQTGTVAGTVIDAETQAPIDGASVQLSGIRPATTDQAGRFQIINVPPGRYVLQAIRSGMTLVRDDRSSGSITVSPGGDVRNVRLRMASFGVIRGHIRDEKGNPLSGVSVQALVLTYEKGRRVLVEPSLADGILNSSADTNENGEYRLDLPAGVYYVSGQMRSSAVTDPGAAHVQGGKQKIYYPGGTDATFATPVKVGSLALSGIDFSLPPTPAMFKVYVRLEGVAAASQHFIPAGGLIAELRDRFSLERLSVVGPLDRGMGAALSGIVINGVPTGSYDLYMDGVMDGGVRGRGMTPIDIRGEDLHDVVVSLQPAQDIAGRVSRMDSSIPLPLPGLTVRLGTRSTTVQPNGEFLISGVLSGTYSVVLDGLPPEAYIADIRYGGNSLHKTAHNLNGPELQVGLSGTPLQILVAYNGGAIDGVIEEQAAAAGAIVVLVPDASRRFVQSDYRTAVAGPTGSFSFHGVPPGVYQLFAWDSVPDTAWLNTEFMARWEGRGQVVLLEAGSRVNVRPRLLSKEN